MSEFLLLVGKFHGLNDHRLIRSDGELSAAVVIRIIYCRVSN
jgi:hypothetical protein